MSESGATTDSFGEPRLSLGTRTRRLVASALEEDAASTDPSAAVFPPEHRSSAELVARHPLVVAGQPLVRAVYEALDEPVSYRRRVDEGSWCDGSETIGELEGPTATLLRGERTALNFLQRLCGIATETARCAAELDGSETSIVDTRKTLPGYRELDKYAVRCGGGSNHRYGLGGGVIVKDNHIAAAGSIDRAVRTIREAAPHLLRIEVEVENLAELDRALEAGADAVMLDNMSTDAMERAVDRVRTRAGADVLIEASGNITRERLGELAEIGLDFISSGALTHSVDAADISFQIDAPS